MLTSGRLSITVALLFELRKSHNDTSTDTSSIVDKKTLTMD